MNERANYGHSEYVNALWSYMRPHAKHCVWMFSDLQQRDPVNARQCMETALEDYRILEADAAQIWYLGDAVEGNNPDHLTEMAKMQDEGFGSLGIPLCYVTGNHDYDYAWTTNETTDKPWIPFWETVRAHEGWHTTDDPEQLYFKQKLGDYTVFFLSDHVSRENKWLITHGVFRYGKELYPTEEKVAEWERLRLEIEHTQGPVITASHYAFRGGNRENPMFDPLLPLPSNVRLHVYGHSHIGDFAWGKQHAYRRISCVDWHDIPQIDVSSLENIRAEFCRSVFLLILEDDSFALFFRDHDHHCFCEAYFPSKENFMPYRDAFSE